MSSSTTTTTADTSDPSLAATRTLTVKHCRLVIALRCRSALSRVQNIIAACPGALEVKDAKGRCPLFEVLRRTHDYDYDPDPNPDPDPDPDRSARARRWLLDVVKLLVESGPLSLLLEKDSTGQCPLHFAIENGASEEVIQYLVDKEPLALRQRDARGLLPAHMAVAVLDGTIGVRLPVVRAVVEPFAFAQLIRTRSHQLPLTIAITNCCRCWSSSFTGSGIGTVGQEHLELIKYLAETSPESVGHTDFSDGKNAVHVAAELGAPAELMNVLLQVRPDALRHADRRLGWMPIHYAAKSSTTPAGFESFRRLVEAWPESLQQRTEGRTGDYPIHIVLTTGRRWSSVRLPATIGAALAAFAAANVAAANAAAAAAAVPLVEQVRYILTQWPDAIRCRAGSDQRIPLHRALEDGLPNTVLDLLLDAWPESVLEATHDGESILPALLEEPERFVDAVRYLVNRDDRILDQRSRTDMSLPIHNVVAKEASPGAADFDRTATAAAARDGVRYLLEQRPGHMHARDANGCTPIHRALEVSHPLHGVVEHLVEAGPASLLLEKNHKGWVPAHVVAAHCVTGLFTAKFLMDRCPGSLRVPDNDGNLPIHIVVSHNGRRTHMIRFVAQRDPAAALERNCDGWSPLHLVVIHRLPELAAKFLLEQQPAAASVASSRDGLLPLHVAAQGGDSCLPLVKVLVEAQPDTALIPDNDGRLALHCAAVCVEPSVEVAQCLVTCRSEAAMVATTDGAQQLPLHCALAAACHVDDEASSSSSSSSSWLLPLVKVLVEAAPASLRIRDGLGRIPLVAAALNPSTPVDVLWYLMTECPAASVEAFAPGG